MTAAYPADPETSRRRRLRGTAAPQGYSTLLARENTTKEISTSLLYLENGFLYISYFHFFSWASLWISA
jgi:hypothetical protein